MGKTESAAGLTPAQADVTARRFRRASPATATVLGGLALILAAVAVPLGGLTVLNIGSDLLELVFAGVGVVVARRQPRNPIGWILLIFIFMALLGDDAGAYAVLAYTHGHRGLPLAPVAVLLAPLGYLAIPVFPLIILLFPDGRLTSRRWRWVLGAYAMLATFLAATIYTRRSLRSRVTRTASTPPVTPPTPIIPRAGSASSSCRSC